MNQQELSHALRKEAIKNGHAVQTLASGYSMFPFLRKGDLLTVEPVSMDKIKRGDVVVFESEEKWIAHRVISISNFLNTIELTLRGDTRLHKDPIVHLENYVGKVVGFKRNGKDNCSMEKTTMKLYSLWIISTGRFRAGLLFSAIQFLTRLYKFLKF